MSELTAIGMEQMQAVIESPEFDILYDIYDQGATDADAIQDALENLARVINAAVEAMKSAR